MFTFFYIIFYIYLFTNVFGIVPSFFFFNNEAAFLSFFFFNLGKALLFIYLFLYLFLAVLGPRLRARASSSCGKRGPLFIAVRGPFHYRGLSCCGAQAPDAQAQ